MLRWLAMFSMFVDHLGYYLYPYLPNPVYTGMRIIGRFAMPIFAYYLALGYRRTRNLFYYFLRLLATAVISQLVIYQTNVICHYSASFTDFNFVFNLCLGLLFLAGFELVTRSYPEVIMKLQPAEPSAENPFQLPFHSKETVFGFKLKAIWGLLLGLIIMGTVILLNFRFDISYHIYGIGLIWIFYYAEEFRETERQMRFAFWGLTVLTLLFFAAMYFFPQLFPQYSPSQFYAILSVPLIYKLSGRQLAAAKAGAESLPPAEQGSHQARRRAVTERLERQENRRSSRLLTRCIGYLFYPLHFYLVLLIRYLYILLFV